MIIFETDNKVNYVDDNNVFVGADTTQHCCEDFRSLVTNSPDLEYDYDDKFVECSVQTNHKFPTEAEPNEEFSEYSFDTTYHQMYGWSDGGRRATFRLVAEGKEDLFLHFVNAQNGYYTHEIEYKINGELIEEYGV